MVKIGEIKSCSEIDWERERVVWWRGTKTKLDDGSVLYFVLVVRSSRSVYQSISVEVGPGKKRKKDERRRDERKGKIDGVECALRRVFAVREENWSPDKSRNGKKRNGRRSSFSIFLRSDQLIFGHVADEKRYDWKVATIANRKLFFTLTLIADVTARFLDFSREQNRSG